jgi:hypothetical protein
MWKLPHFLVSNPPLVAHEFDIVSGEYDVLVPIEITVFSSTIATCAVLCYFYCWHVPTRAWHVPLNWAIDPQRLWVRRNRLG